ncbi:MAG: DUF2812 domain-containing protein [Anaerolineales bacterium]|nr:DUF2812 domain-containing protein [Anaerolineales bacterium]
MTTMKKFHWFWAWEDEKEEAWLRQMAQSGWHFKSVTAPGFYTLEQGAPRDDVYRLDFFTQAKDKANYLQIFHDAGWEYLGENGSWQYFRKTSINGEAPEIYSDNASKAQKYSRMMLLLTVFLPILTITMVNLSRQVGTGLFFEIATFGLFLLMLLYIFAMLNLLHRLSQLKKKV